MNIIYTYVPKEDEKKLDSEFFFIDIILFLLGVSKIKKYKNVDDKIILYSTEEFSKLFYKLELFDEYRIVPDIEKYLQNQLYDFCHKNCIYKIFIAKEQSEPFITLDHDFIIYEKEFFDFVKKQELVFSHKECIKEPIFAQTYLPTYNKVLNTLEKKDLVLSELNLDYAINVSISGGNRLDIIKESYTKICNFYINNYIFLNTLPMMTMFLEQFLFSGQLLNYNVEPYYCWNDIQLKKCYHYTGHRYEPDIRKEIVNDLIEEDEKIYKFIKENFNFYPSYMK